MGPCDLQLSRCVGKAGQVNVAGIDCGTNSIRLLIAAVAPDGSLRDVVREMRVVRLGQGVDRTGEFAGEALARTFEAAEEYAAECRAHGVESIRFAATSAARDARNRGVFLDGIRSRLGVPPQILSGEEEARASFTGAVSGMPSGTESPLLAVDLGGGSTEIALGTMSGELLGAHSMDIGCVRMHERHMGAEVPDSDAVQAARADVNAALDAAEEHVDLGAAKGLIGLAGSVTTITAKALGLEVYDPQRIHGTFLSVEETLAACEWFVSSTRAQRETLGFMHPGRVDVIAAGAVVWGEVVKRVAARIGEAGGRLAGITTSEHDILDGLAMWAASEPQVPSFLDKGMSTEQ